MPQIIGKGRGTIMRIRERKRELFLVIIIGFGLALSLLSRITWGEGVGQSRQDRILGSVRDRDRVLGEDFPSQQQVTRLNAILEQNAILIEQNTEIIRLLGEINSSIRQMGTRTEGLTKALQSSDNRETVLTDQNDQIINLLAEMNKFLADLPEQSKTLKDILENVAQPKVEEKQPPLRPVGETRKISTPLNPGSSR
ncbi:MAG: hypothetical protein HY731_01850 [Candidatus Tectomicrobia bacterium]|nr:hypothetical protein [Candidatus Tectomicrobia bacterium]